MHPSSFYNSKAPCDYSISILKIFLDSCRQTKGIKKVFWHGYLLIIIDMFFVLGVLGILNLVFNLMYPAAHFKKVFIDIASLSFYLNAYISLSFVALQHIRGLPIRCEMALRLGKVKKYLILSGIMLWLLGFIGVTITDHWSMYILTLNLNVILYQFAIIFEVMLLVFIAIYILQVATITILLVLDKSVPPLKSFKLSFKSINKHCFKNIILGLFTWITTIFLALATFGIGLIWLKPILTITNAIQYQNLSCEEPTVS